MTITPNRKALKDIADFNIDSQFFQQYGVQVFNYNGEETSDYQNLCRKFSLVIDDMLKTIQEIKVHITIIDE